jgi:tripartite-type tricarboxylate transporter receptor subunit TctC
MRLPRRRFVELAAGAVAVHAWPRFAWAQSYPERPVRVIVPYAPGGPTDVITRLVAQRLSDHIGKQFFVENMGGGGGNIGMGRAAKAAPDGYTVLVVNPSYVINPTLYDKVPYEFGKDFDPVTLMVLTTLVLAVHPSVPARTMSELVALIRANPGKYSYASPGTGTPGHLVGEQFRLSLGLDLVHVPFNSAGLAVGSSVARHTPICFASPSPAAQQVIEGRLRGLAVTSKARSRSLPVCPPRRRQVSPALPATTGRASSCRPGRRARSSASSITRSSPSWRSPMSRSAWRCSALSRSRARRRNSPGRPETSSMPGPR